MAVEILPRQMMKETNKILHMLTAALCYFKYCNIYVDLKVPVLRE